jgi:hypothetical protein
LVISHWSLVIIGYFWVLTTNNYSISQVSEVHPDPDRLPITDYRLPITHSQFPIPHSH